jgi:hypothetical protein
VHGQTVSETFAVDLTRHKKTYRHARVVTCVCRRQYNKHAYALYYSTFYQPSLPQGSLATIGTLMNCALPVFLERTLPRVDQRLLGRT